MYVRVLKECNCTLSGWNDREWANQWSNADDWRRSVSATRLTVGWTIANAIRVSPVADNPHLCRIDLQPNEGRESFFTNVPWASIEVLREKPV